ncbi:acyl-CoA thioester hydrolase [Parasphingorhabdus marina DSM 22363]|uniref:Acyl-CoA thioester hydrolase n=1 Tax=Parasphingorhabdus marina DSM 22363 TaxID=1123272 RepID=A0A1N6CSZ6_9SPHN|nr:thioesterase family protein [Parasphingorhabdus marina]SIN61514.1 acyl-CoA thioester hydrolase [Parasphingorhabdus marina DSM 22363]
MPGKKQDRVLPVRADYRSGSRITTRWNDNDPYGHVNNAIYYFWFDTAVNRYLVEQDVLDIVGGDTIGLVVQTGCEYFAPIAFPDDVTARIRVDRLGNSSVTYGVGLFRGEEQTASAAGSFTHVYVNRETRRPVPLPGPLRNALEAIAI